jgi:hypothetical protein
MKAVRDFPKVIFSSPGKNFHSPLAGRVPGGESHPEKSITNVGRENLRIMAGAWHRLC